MFPDAKVIHTHREPREVVPSFASMMAHTGALLTADVDARAVGRRVADQMVNSVERAIVARRTVGEGRVLDVQYTDLVGDTLGTMRRIYDFLELEWSDASVGRMQRWLGENPQHKYGRHRYTLADFGLDGDEIDDRFKAYREHFGVEQKAE